MKKLLLILALVIPVSGSSLESTETFSSNIVCFDTESLFQELKDKYREAPIIMGLTDDIAKSTMTLWTDPVTKSWTIVASSGKISCVVGSGTHLKVVRSGKLV